MVISEIPYAILHACMHARLPEWLNTCKHVVRMNACMLEGQYACTPAYKIANKLACLHAYTPVRLLPACRLACMHDCRHACIHACLPAAYMYACLSVLLPAYTRVSAYLKACLNARVHACLHVCLPACMLACKLA